MGRGDRQGLSLGDLGHVLGIAETFRRFWLRIVVERLALGADQTGVLGFAPALCGAVHAGTMSWLAGANPSPIALDDGQVRGTLGTLGQGVGSLGIGITTLGQFPTDVVHYTLDRLGRDRLVTHVSHHQHCPLERVSAAANVIRWINKGVSSRASNPSVSVSGEKGSAAGRAITLQLL